MSLRKSIDNDNKKDNGATGSCQQQQLQQQQVLASWKQGQRGHVSCSS